MDADIARGFMGTDGHRTGKIAPWLTTIFLLLSLADVAWSYSRLPETMATHFGAGGEPNGWSSREGFATLTVGMILLLAGIFFGFPALFGRLPASLINIPHRRYWLAPERRQHTERILATATHRMGAATAFLILVTVHAVLQYNLGERSDLGPLFLWSLVAYLVYTVIWTVGLFLRFRPAGDEARERLP